MIFVVMECLFILLIIYTGTVLVEIAHKMEMDCDVSIKKKNLFLSDAAQSKKSPFCKVTHWLERNEMAKVNTNI